MASSAAASSGLVGGASSVGLACSSVLISSSRVSSMFSSGCGCSLVASAAGSGVGGVCCFSWVVMGWFLLCFYFSGSPVSSAFGVGSDFAVCACDDPGWDGFFFFAGFG